MPLTLRLRLLACLATSSAAALHAQCPDGTPPPCALARTVAARVSVPSAADRSRRFLVLPFRNVTRQPEQDWLVEGSTTMLSDALGRWQGITVVADERLYPAIKRAGIAPGSVIDEARVRRIAEETGGWTAVTGEVIATGGRVRVTARAWDVPTNRELVRAASEVAPGGDVRFAFDSVSLRLLRSAGFDNATADLANATTHDLDAYRAYLRGLAHMRRSEIKSATADFQEAVKADSGFALAWARLAEATLAAEPASLFTAAPKGSQYAARALALSSKLPPRERQLVAVTDASFRAQFADVRRGVQTLLAADSTDPDALQALVGLELFDPVLVPVPGGQRPGGSLNRAARAAKRLAELDPTRNQMFGVLSGIYASAGMTGSSPIVAVDRAPSSYQDLMQTLAQREHLRVYYSVLRDTIVLVPAESLASIPKDSLSAWRKSARGVARQWAERWVAAAAPNESAPHQLLSELYALDDEYAAALGALARAESLGVQSPIWAAPARRLYFQGRAGNLPVATRLADSLVAAGFFANPNSVMYNTDAESWAFALELVAGHLERAAMLLDQHTGFVRMITPGDPAPSHSALRRLMGSLDPAEEPRMSRAFRARQLDSALAHVREYAASERIGPWLPMILDLLADATGEAKASAARMLKPADSLATLGQPTLAFHVARIALGYDSTLESAAAAFAWYRTGVETMNTARLATQSRFHPGAATITADRAEFEWKVDDATPFTWNRPETPPGRGEYRWDITVESEGRYHRLVVAAPTKPGGTTPATGTLANILVPSATRAVLTGALGADGELKGTTLLQGVALRTELVPGALKLVVTDRALIETLRRARPAQARFRFSPCVRRVGEKEQCVDERVTISYP